MMSLYMWYLKSKSIYKTNRLKKQTNLLPKGKGVGRGKLRVWVNRYTMLYIK